MWNVLHTAPNSELRVSRYLAVQEVESYIPQFAPSARTRPGSVRDRKPRLVFPRYVFLRPAAGFRDWDRIRWAPGVNRLLDQDGSTAVVEDEIIEHLRRRLAGGELRAGHTWLRGQPVSIVRGPLRMVDAIFERELAAPDRVRILITLLGRQLPIDVDPAILSAAI